MSIAGRQCPPPASAPAITPNTKGAAPSASVRATPRIASARPRSFGTRTSMRTASNRGPAPARKKPDITITGSAYRSL
jgi:hypothetical protein